MAVTLHDAFIGDFPTTQAFGHEIYSATYLNGYYHAFGFNGHEGVDFGLPTGVAVIAAVQGLVLHAGAELAWGAYGTFIEIWDDVQHVAVLYGHLREARVRVGQRVWVGQLLGFSDNTGHSSGPHLHLGACLTDAAGKRLNTTNGWKGWVNPTGPLFSWKITNPATPAYGPPLTAPTPPVIIPPPPPVDPAPPKPDPAVVQLEAEVAALTSENTQLKALGAGYLARLAQIRDLTNP